MAAKLILILAFGFHVTDAYRHDTYTIKRDGGVVPKFSEYLDKPDCYRTGCTELHNSRSEGIAINTPKKQKPQKKDESDLIFLDFWRTATNLEIQPVVVISDLNVEKQLEYPQEEPRLE